LDHVYVGLSLGKFRAPYRCFASSEGPRIVLQFADSEGPGLYLNICRRNRRFFVVIMGT
jgi:hypothetical protein